jgi:retron-type reverse transcriptase
MNDRNIIGRFNTHDLFDGLVSVESLLNAWRSFKKDKNPHKDIFSFEFDLEDHLFKLHRELSDGAYKHGGYTSFYVSDPKLRHIHKAPVRDRVIHHAAVNLVGPFFERSFIFDSYASRKGKGIHKGFKRLEQFAWKLSQNNTKTVWVLKCDVRRFFDSIDHAILLKLLSKKIQDDKLMSVIDVIVRSFEKSPGKGLPLGNLTSQLFSNIYLNELDQFVKRELHVRYYIRYADDFVILSRDREYLESLLSQIRAFLPSNLAVELHPGKVLLRKWHQGIDFLGFISFPYYSLVRIKTRKRMHKKVSFKVKMFRTGKIDYEKLMQSLNSYLGITTHAEGYKIRQKLLNLVNQQEDDSTH